MQQMRKLDKLRIELSNSSVDGLNIRVHEGEGLERAMCGRHVIVKCCVWKRRIVMDYKVNMASKEQ